MGRRHPRARPPPEPVLQAVRDGHRCQGVVIERKVANAGDVLLREIAGRLRACLREGDVIGRIGGDEFVVLIEEFNDAECLALVAQKILDTVARPVAVRGQDCRVTSSVGISTYPQDGKDSQALLRNADSAMYRAKEQGKNRFEFYSV